jgi:methionine synthase I (cobalamin-dependent)
VNGFLERLVAGPCLLLDGGMGSMLIAAGLPPGVPPERAVLDAPRDVAAVHEAYVGAGCDAVHTCTFGGNSVRLASSGLEDSCEAINIAAVKLARESGAKFVIFDVGPTGEYLPPVGTGDAGRWRAAFERQAMAVAGEPIDAFHVETMSDVREARVALQALRSLSPGIPVIVSMTFERRKKGFFTIFGDPAVDALGALAREGASAVGANCSITSTEMMELGMALSGKVDAPVVLQPNAGQPEPTASGVRYRQSPDEFAANMDTMARQGAAAVGGCCGTDPIFIAALRRRLDARGGS